MQGIKIAIVTGAGTGIGKAVSHGLLEIGYSVVFSGRRQHVLEDAVKEANVDANRTLIVPTNVGDPASVKILFERTKEKFGRLDLLVNNAGVSAPMIPLEELTFDQWQEVLSTNLTGTFLCTQEAFKIMKAQSPQGGRIINIGSVSAQVPRPMSAPYTATKHAITGLTKSTSLDGRQFNIACSQIDIGNAATHFASKVQEGILQANGSIQAEPVMDVKDVASMIVHMSNLSLDANVLFTTMLATKMPFTGRG